ncbi:Regulator of rDNA transcription protein 15 [Capsicum baccatum]|uniref:Regulator of rDNA transcription protein 15 n=1 Tax=Capsicum baccatum TaxID=33114 RepID=A0A2G2VI29_CAPBA|nr:Regulator of rDNA transcription protein 15 [Capsicum baccatum]
MVRIRTGNQNQTSFYPSVPHDISVLVELILGHQHYLLTDVPPQPNSPHDNVFCPNRPTEHSSPSFGFRQVYSSVDSHTCQTRWFVFQDGSNGKPTGQRPERAEAKACRRRAMPATIEETAFHERIESLGFGCPLIHAGPRPESVGGPAHHRSTSDWGTSPTRIRFPPDNFKHSLTLFPKSFSSLPRGTCSLSVCHPYLALDEIHHPIWAAFLNNPTRRQCLMVRQGPGIIGLSPSLAPPSRGLGPGPPLRTLL